jgi:hypothetical protein
VYGAGGTGSGAAAAENRAEEQHTARRDAGEIIRDQSVDQLAYAGSRAPVGQQVRARAQTGEGRALLQNVVGAKRGELGADRRQPAVAIEEE